MMAQECGSGDPPSLPSIATVSQRNAGQLAVKVYGGVNHTNENAAARGAWRLPAGSEVTACGNRNLARSWHVIVRARS